MGWESGGRVRLGWLLVLRDWCFWLVSNLLMDRCRDLVALNPSRARKQAVASNGSIVNELSVLPFARSLNVLKGP
jgi:hypothetical protein